jgi:hypothetical protein
MRQALGLHEGQRIKARAKIERYGSRHGASTYLLRDVADASTNRQLTVHLWIAVGKWAQGLRPGDTIAFDARVAIYAKGYVGRRDDIDKPAALDWHLERPTKVEISRVRAYPADQVSGVAPIKPDTWRWVNELE